MGTERGLKVPIGILLNKLRALIAAGEKDEFSTYRRIVDKEIRCSTDHKAYIYQQLRRTLHKKNSVSAERYVFLVNQLGNVTDLSNKRVLSVGCRSRDEIECLFKAGAEYVIGIDLFSEDERILVMDMHEMSFDDESFHIIFSCHSLEHARDYEIVVSEFVRVAKDGALIVVEVPVNFDAEQTGGTDIWDYESLDGLKNIFGSHIDHVLYEEFLPAGSSPDSGTDIVRLMFRLRKNIEGCQKGLDYP